jgi:hypothetical protein
MSAIGRVGMSRGIEEQYGKSLLEGVFVFLPLKDEKRSTKEGRDNINTQTNKR